MFNKKKKRWFQGKPNYKKNEGEEEPHFSANDGNGINKPKIQPVVTEQVVQKPEEPPIEVPKELLPDQDNSTRDAILVNPVNCPICNMPIRNPHTAMRHKETKELAHFDCILRNLSKENTAKLGRFKRIYYVGAGNFAIVKEILDKRGFLKSYEILEKINYESREK
jgi:hypothetical protein